MVATESSTVEPITAVTPSAVTDPGAARGGWVDSTADSNALHPGVSARLRLDASRALNCANAFVRTFLNPRLRSGRL
jgi:hypothetical protein